MTASDLIYRASNEAATVRLGHALAEALPKRAVIALHGTLGAGKTRLVQTIADGIGVPAGSVTSPTFVLAQEYHAKRTLYHVDAYRLTTADEAYEFGLDEYLSAEAITCIEWAERVADLLPEDRLDITIDVEAGGARAFNIAARGPTAREALERLRSVLKGLST